MLTIQTSIRCPTGRGRRTLFEDQHFLRPHFTKYRTSTVMYSIIQSKAMLVRTECTSVQNGLSETLLPFHRLRAFPP